MIVAKTISQIKSKIVKLSGKRISFVPTMGALHDGHLSLIKKAKEVSDIVIVSIFVNKMQFNDLSDYENYPRQDLQDLEKLKSCAVDLVFMPDEKEMSEEKVDVKTIPENLTNCLCGSSRPGHFEGVVLIVTKLFKIIKPDLAVFGQKDFQQLAIVKEIAKDMNVEILAGEIFREESGLAMSSRNQRLSEADKIKAAQIFETLLNIKDKLLKEPNKVLDILFEESKKLQEFGFGKIDYLEIRQEDSLKLVTKLDFTKPSRIFIAVHLGSVRLIDNVRFC